MARVVGIDLRAAHVRAVLLQVGFRQCSIEQMREASVEVGQSIDDMVRACVAPLLEHGEPFSVALDGELTFMHRLELPATASKQVDEILPFELEAQVPLNIDELVFDYVTLRRQRSDGKLQLFTGAARTTSVRARIEQFRRALGHEPARIGCGPAPFANLVRVSPALAGPGPFGIVDLGGGRTEVLLLSRGEVVFARTMLRGVEGLPGSAGPLAAELRQTFSAWVARGGEPVVGAFLVGGGSQVMGAEEFFSGELGLPVSVLPPMNFEGLTPEQVEQLPRFAKAIGLALGLADRGHDVDLRQGGLGFRRGYSFLKEKIPILSGLGLAILISAGFSAWAELRAIERDREGLIAELTRTSQLVLGKPIDDPVAADEELQKIKGKDEADPMPAFDAFDAMVEISKAVPESYEHDIEEFDLQRGRLKVNGVVGTTAEAQAIVDQFKQHACLADAKISRVAQQINSQRQKYVLEAQVKCPGDEKGAKPKSANPGSSE